MPSQPLLTAAQLSQLLRSARKRAGLTQADVGARLGLSQNRVSHLEAHADELIALLDLGAGSLWNGPDALFALAARGLAREGLQLGDAARTLPAPTGAPLSLWGLGLLVRFLGSGDFVLRLLPALAALACAFCLLTVAIDVGVGRHAGGLGGLLFLALPLTYELSHRVLPDMLIAASATFAVALCSHALHGHHFDRHIMPSHAEDDAPAPLPLRRTPMALAAGAIGVAAMVSRRAALIALLFAVLDVLLVNRYLLRKRRVWLALSSGVALILLAARVHGPGAIGGLWQLGVAALRTLGRPQLFAEARAVGALLWTQGASLYDAAAGGVPLAGGANALVTGYAPLAGRVLIVAAGFGVLFSLIRRPSRPLALWLLSSGILSIVGAGGEPRRALVLLLPPLALCAAVGIETPVRWLGRLGNLTTMAAVAGILAAWVNGQAVLHRDDTVRALAQSQRRAPAGALLCTVGLPAAAARHYTGRPVSEFRSAAELSAALGREQPLSCLIPAELRDAVAQALLGQRDFERAQAARVRTRGRREPGAALGSVLATVLDFEEPPPDAPGPKVLLVNR